MFLISLAVVILTVILSMNQFASLYYFIDLPTFLLLLIICVPFLISTGLLKDFNNAFAIALSKKKKATLTEIKRAVEAVTLTIKSLLYTGIFIFMMSLFTILHMMDTPETLGPKISICILSIIYVCIFVLILLPLRTILNLRIIEYMPESDADEAEGSSL